MQTKQSISWQWKNKEDLIMAKYLARRIFLGKLDYFEVCLKYPALKADIDAELARLREED